MSTRLDITLPEGAAALADALTGAGNDAVLVGGVVRDGLLDRPTADLDLVTDATPARVRALAEGLPGVRSVYPLGERFGTIGIALEDGSALEVTRWREAALARTDTTERFSADAAVRDFTVNALGAEWPGLELLDPTGGRADLRAKVLRCPGRAADRLAEDPVRVLRTARFAAELGFEPDTSLSAALPTAAPLLARVAPERVRVELTRTLVAPDAVRGLELLHACGALAVALPEVAALDGVTQPSFHDLDALAHTLQAVGLAPATPVMRWSTLLHDVGKAPARTVHADGRIRFFRHAQASARMAAEVCGRLRFSRADTEAVVHLVATHMRLGELDTENLRAVDRAVRALDLVVPGDPPRVLASAEDAIKIMLADLGATAHRHEVPETRERLERAVALSRERGTAQAVHSPVRGRELMHELGLAPGPSVGEAMRAIEDAIGDGRIAPGDKDAAMRVARETLARRRV